MLAAVYIQSMPASAICCKWRHCVPCKMLLLLWRWPHLLKVESICTGLVSRHLLVQYFSLMWWLKLYGIYATTTTVLRPLYRSTCISRHLQLRTGGFCWCKVLTFTKFYHEWMRTHMLANWRWLLGRPHTTRMKNIHLSLLDHGIHGVRDLVQNRPRWRLVSLHSVMHS